MSLRVSINGEDVTAEVDLSAASDLPSGPGHFPTEAELRMGLQWSPCAARGCERIDAKRFDWDEGTRIYLCEDHRIALGLPSEVVPT
jgi:hypothetical protein